MIHLVRGKNTHGTWGLDLIGSAKGFNLSASQIKRYKAARCREKPLKKCRCACTNNRIQGYARILRYRGTSTYILVPAGK